MAQMQNKDVLLKIQELYCNNPTNPTSRFSKRDLLRHLKKAKMVAQDYPGANLQHHLQALQNDGLIKRVVRGHYVYIGKKVVVSSTIKTTGSASPAPATPRGIDPFVREMARLKGRLMDANQEIAQWQEELGKMIKSRDEIQSRIDEGNRIAQTMSNALQDSRRFLSETDDSNNDSEVNDNTSDRLL